MKATDRSTDADKADIAREFQHAVVDVLRREGARRASPLRAAIGWSSPAAWERTGNCVRGLRKRWRAAAVKCSFPTWRSVPDNGAMIALVGALRLANSKMGDYEFSVRPRWDLASLPAA